MMKPSPNPINAKDNINQNGPGKRLLTVNVVEKTTPSVPLYADMVNGINNNGILYPPASW